MGLDMYLTRNTYVKQWDHQTPSERWLVTATKGGNPTPVKSERISYITEQVAYWRKANAIHAWFVRECQEGKDECQETYVSREDLKRLLEVCRTVRDDNSKAATLLPVQSGFFFGSTDYDEGYFEDIKETFDVLAKLLDEPTCGDFYYRSSW